MKRIIVFVLGLFLLFSLSSCSEKTVKASGSNITESYDVNGDYDELVIENIRIVRGTNSTGPRASITNSETKTLAISMQESLKDCIKVNKTGKKITISGDRYTKYDTDYQVTIDITGFVFKNIYLSGAVICSVDDIEVNDDATYHASGASIFNMKSIISNNLNIKLSGASQLRATNVETNNVTIDASGASQVGVAGTCSSSTIGLSGASHFGSYDFSVDTLVINISGASVIEITANVSITGSASGASVITHKGNATTDVSVSGASQVLRRTTQV